MTRKYEDAFVLNGFDNWKKGRERFERHQVSDCHREAQLKLKSMQAPTVMDQLVSQANKDKTENRSMLLKQLSSLKFLLRQGLAVRGHSDRDGNLVQLMELRSEDSPGLRRWLDSNHYLSPQIVNEMITLMGNTLLCKLLVKYVKLAGTQS